MTIDSIERSIQDSAPSELYDFSTPNAAWRYTSDGVRRIYLAQEYLPVAIERTEPGSTTTANAPQFYVTLPYDLPVVRSNAFARTPPRWLYLVVWRGQGNLYTPYWSGYITSITMEGRWAKMLCPGLLGSALATQIPTITYHQGCAHPLYGRYCTIDKNTRVLPTFVTVQDGTTLQLNSTGGQADQWYRGGYIQRQSDNEERLILDQVLKTIIIDAPFPELHNGDFVNIYDGCNHDVFTCHDKFGNEANYGGTPYIPSLNMFLGQMRGKA